MDTRIQIVAVVTSASLFLLVLEFVRQKRFLERYALLWLFSASVLLGLSIWRGALEELAQLVGVSYPPNALFLIAFGFALALLLHFSIATSRLTDQTKILAQRLAIAEERIRQVEEAGGREPKAEPGQRDARPLSRATHREQQPATAGDRGLR